MKKLILYFLIFCFFKLHLSLAWGFEVNFKSEITCDLFHNDKKFATKSWPLNTDEDGGYLNWATDTIIEWHESIAVNEDPLTWVVMFYQVDRYSGKGSWDSTTDLSNEFFLKNFLNKNLKRRNSHLILKKYLDLNGNISCKEASKKF